jgi:hypothetical protein
MLLLGYPDALRPVPPLLTGACWKTAKRQKFVSRGLRPLGRAYCPTRR